MTWDVPYAVSWAQSLFVQLQFRVNDVSRFFLPDLAGSWNSKDFPLPYPPKQTPRKLLNSFPQVYKWGLSTDAALSTGECCWILCTDPSCSGVSGALVQDKAGKGRSGEASIVEEADSLIGQT